MNSDNFEQRLQHQSPRQIPTEWRNEILSAAHRPLAAPKRSEGGSSISHLLSSILWPHPRAWAGLAAVWIFIFALNFATRDEASLAKAKSAVPPSPEVLMVLKQQQQLRAELVGLLEPRDTDRAKTFLPRPRTERRNETEIV